MEASSSCGGKLLQRHAEGRRQRASPRGGRVRNTRTGVELLSVRGIIGHSRAHIRRRRLPSCPCSGRSLRQGQRCMPPDHQDTHPSQLPGRDDSRSSCTSPLQTGYPLASLGSRVSARGRTVLLCEREHLLAPFETISRQELRVDACIPCTSQDLFQVVCM